MAVTFCSFTRYIDYMKVILRDYQILAADRAREAYQQGYRAPLLALPTGAGKTVIFCYMTEQAAAREKRIYILVHRQELLRQTSEKLDLFGVPHGLVSPAHAMSGDHVQVASVQTLARRLHRLPPPDLIVVDEAHHACAGTWRKIIEHWPNALLLGVTATPCRLDGKGLGQNSGGFFDILVEGPTIPDLIEHGFLAQPVVYAPPSGVDLSGVKTRAGDYAKDQVEERVDKPKITGCAIEHYNRICPNVPAIAFCSSVQHAEHVAQQFNAAGIVAASLDGTMTDAVRKARIQALGSGQIKVLTSCEIVSEGTDIPIVTAAILLRPTQSTGLYLQQVGRVLRPFEGKQCAVILDHVGNVFRHGMPDDIRSWSLSGAAMRDRKKQDQELKIKQCEKCFAIYRAQIVACPQCGHIPAIKDRSPQQVSGELRQITKDDIKNKMQGVKPTGERLNRLMRLAHSLGLNGNFAYRVALRQEYRDKFKPQAPVYAD